MSAHVRHNSGAVEWYTPPAVVEAAREVLGGIDLDPASCPEANAVVGAARFYSKDDDGLAQPWAGRVFMNPPYSVGVIGRFVQKLIDDYRGRRVTEAVVMTNNGTETQWCQRLIAACSAVCFPRGRIACSHTGKGKSTTPLQGQLISYLGCRPERFCAVFGRFGVAFRWHHVTKLDGLFAQPEGRPPLFLRAMTAAERKRRSRERRSA